MREFTIYVNINGDEYLDTIKVNCNHFDIVDNRTVIADGATISFKEDMYAVSLNGMDIWKNNNE